MGGSTTQQIAYLLRDEYTTALSAGSVHSTAAEPGPGTRSVVDTSSLISLSAGRLQKSGSAPTIFTDPRVYYADVALARTPGLIVQFRFVLVSGSAFHILGLRSATTGGSSSVPVGFYGVGGTFQAWDGANGAEIAPMTDGVPYVLSVVLRATGAVLFIQGGEVYKDHTCVWSIDYGTAAPLYVSPGNYYSTPATSVDYVRVWQGAASLPDVLTLNAPTPTSDTVVTGVASGITTLAVTAPGVLSGAAGIKFNVQDANNYWYAYFNDAGAFLLDKVVSGSADGSSPYVNVGSAIAGAGARSIRILRNGSTIRCYTFDGSYWTKRGSDVTSSTYSAETGVAAVASAGWTLGALTARPAENAAYNELGDLRSLLVFDGDSLTLGTGSTAGNSYPDQTLALLGGESLYKFHNFGFSGAKTYQIAADVATQTDVLYGARYPLNVYALWVATNNLKLAEAVATVYAEYVALCEDRRAVGFKVIAFTVLPRHDSVPGGFEADRQSFNTLIRANWSTFADALADVAADSRIGDAGDDNDATYYSDEVHLTDAGYAVVASITASAIRTL
jgi:lysophospholipase L1-like esterase